MHSQTYTKRRILNRPEDGTEFEVETRTVYTVKALKRVAFLINLPVALPFVGIHFIIERIFVVIHIVSTQSNTKVKRSFILKEILKSYWSIPPRSRDKK